MHKAIKIECYQNTANYKKPSSIDVQESYKFPPYSTVIGMIHNLCGFKEYKQMLVSVQGSYRSTVFNMYTRHFFGKTKGQYIRGLGYAELIIDVDLIIHIQPEDESLFDVIVASLKNPSVYPALGRHEDILRIDEVSIVELEETDEITMKYDAYIPTSILDKGNKIAGTIYNLNKKFAIDEKTNIRYWKEKVKVKYIKKDQIIYFDEPVKKEKDSCLGVFLA